MSYFSIRPNVQTVYFSSNKESTDRRNLPISLNNQQAKQPVCQSSKFGIDHYSWHQNSPTNTNTLQNTISSTNSSNQLKLGEINSSFQDQRLPGFGEIKSGPFVQSYANANVEPRFVTPSFSSMTPTPPTFIPPERSPTGFERPFNYMDSEWDQCSYLESNKAQYGGSFNNSADTNPISPGSSLSVPYYDFDEHAIVNTAYQEPTLMRNQTLTNQALDQATVVNYSENYESCNPRNYNPRIVSATEKIRPIIFKNSDFGNITVPYVSNSTYNSRNSGVKQNNYYEYGSTANTEKINSESSFSLKRQHFPNSTRKHTLSENYYVLPGENHENFNHPTDLSGNSAKKFRNETAKIASYYSSNSKITCTRNTKIKMKISDEIVMDRNEIPPCRNSHPPKVPEMIDTPTSRIHEADSSSVFQTYNERGMSGGLFVNVNNVKQSNQNPNISPISSPECSAMNLVKYDALQYVQSKPKEIRSFSTFKNSLTIPLQSADIVEEPTDLSRCVTVLQNENPNTVNEIDTLEPVLSLSLEKAKKDQPASQNSCKPMSSSIKYQTNKENSEFYTVENMKLYTSAIMNSSQNQDKTNAPKTDLVSLASNSTKQIESNLKDTTLISSLKEFRTLLHESSASQIIKPPTIDYCSVNEKEKVGQQNGVNDTMPTLEDITLKNNASETPVIEKQIVWLDVDTIKLCKNAIDTVILEKENTLSSPSISEDSNDLLAFNRPASENVQSKESEGKIKENLSTEKMSEEISTPTILILEMEKEIIPIQKAVSIDDKALSVDGKGAQNKQNTATSLDHELLKDSLTSEKSPDIQIIDSTGNAISKKSEPCNTFNSSIDDRTLPEKSSLDTRKPCAHSKKKSKTSAPKPKKPTCRSVMTQTLISIINETNFMSQCSFEITHEAIQESIFKDACTPTTYSSSCTPRKNEKYNEKPTKNANVSEKKKPELVPPPIKKPELVLPTVKKPELVLPTKKPELVLPTVKKPELVLPIVKKPSKKRRKDKPVTKGTRRSERQSKQNERLNYALPFDQRQCRICKEYLIFERSVPDQLTISVNKSRDVCSACNICFLQKPILDLNAEKRPHMCTVCGQRFTRKLNLDLHKVKHSKDKPFVCAICSRPYGHKSHLTRHYNSVHRGVII